MTQEKLEKLLQEKIKEIPRNHRRQIVNFKKKALDEIDYLAASYDALEEPKTFFSIINYYIFSKKEDISRKLELLDLLYYNKKINMNELNQISYCWDLVFNIINCAKNEAIKECIK